jgi:2-haloacid dehalogenase
MAAGRLAVDPSEVLLVAAHAWDVAGALAAGCQAAFVARPGKVLDPLADPPELVVADLDELADRLLA